MTWEELEALAQLPQRADPTRDTLLGVPPVPTPQPVDPWPGIADQVRSAVAGMPPPAPPVPRPSLATAGTAYHPVADAVSRWGAGQEPGLLSNLALWGAGPINQAERGARAVLGAAGEMTGVPSAGRAGEALARGDYGQALGQGLMSLPSRFASIPGMLLSGADAQVPDPRLARIRELQAEIGKREKAIRAYGNRSFPSAKARADAVAVETQGITAARDSIKRMEDAMTSETAEAAAAERRRQASAEWAQTPTARAYPWSQPLSTGVGMAVGAALPFARARLATGALNARLAELDRRWGDAVERAQNTRLSAKNRTAAAAEARALEAEFNTAVAEGAHLSRLGSAGIGFTATEMGTGLPSLIDYLSSRADPTGPLAKYTLQANDPINNTGEVMARYLIPGAFGAGLGEIGNELGSLGVRRPTGHSAATAGLKKRYR